MTKSLTLASGRMHQPSFDTTGMTSMKERQELSRSGTTLPEAPKETAPAPVKDPFKMGSSMQITVPVRGQVSKLTQGQVTQLIMLRASAHLLPAWMVEEADAMIRSGKKGSFSLEPDVKQKRVLGTCGIST